MSKIPERLRSRKLWIAVIGSAFTVLLAELGFTPDTIENFKEIILAGLASFAAVDSVKAFKGKK